MQTITIKLVSWQVLTIFLTYNKTDNDKSWNKQFEQWATPTVFRIVESTDN